MSVGTMLEGSKSSAISSASRKISDICIKMGNQFLDQYSLLHFSTGVVAYFFGISATKWLVIHIGFEFVENTQFGMDFINKNLYFWPGGKPRSDDFINMVGDTGAAMLGWWVAQQIEKVGKERKWYKP